MEPNDTQPSGQPGRTVTIQLARDTLILIAALAFLAIAIVLAVIFPGPSSGTPTPVSSNPTQAGTAQPATTQQASAPTNAATAGPTAASAGNATAQPQQGGGSYPAPQTATESQAETAGEGETEQLPQAPATGGTTRTGATAIPTFSPSRPTQPLEGTPGGFAGQPPAYPGPSTPTSQADEPGQTEPPPLVSSQPTSSIAQQTAPTIIPTVQQPRSQPTSQAGSGDSAPTARPATPKPTPAPTAPPVDTLRGTIRWTLAKSPILLRRDQVLAAGATLIIEPGVEVRIAPGVSFFVEGTLYAIGNPDQHVRFVGSTPQRWEGLYGRPGSNITLEHAEIRGGGNGGTVLLSEGGNLVLRNVHVNDNGGHIQVSDSRLEVRDSEIAGNDMPYGSAIEASYASGGFVILTGNRIGGNRMQAGTAPVRISNQSGIDTVNLDIQGNLLLGSVGPDLEIVSNGQLQGGLTCNALIGGTNGLSLRGETSQLPGFALNVRDNAIESHTPPIIPEYLKYGIGRGATSEMALDMRGNWWGNPLGPYEPDRHADGRGEAVGDNIEFDPWLTARPACAPSQ